MSTTTARRRLGCRLEVSSIGLGRMGMLDFHGPADDHVSIDVLNRAIDVGVNFPIEKPRSSRLRIVPNGCSYPCHGGHNVNV
jgi:hypothetical protein